MLIISSQNLEQAQQVSLFENRHNGDEGYAIPLFCTIFASFSFKLNIIIWIERRRSFTLCEGGLCEPLSLYPDSYQHSSSFHLPPLNFFVLTHYERTLVITTSIVT